MSEGILVMVILIKACGGFPNTESLCRLSRTKLNSGLSERLSLCLSLCGKTLFLCHVCFGSASQIYLCRTFQQQCSPYLFWRLILGGFVKQTRLVFWSLLFLWQRAQRHSSPRLSLSINIRFGGKDSLLILLACHFTPSLWNCFH